MSGGWGCDFAGPRYSPGFGRTRRRKDARMSLQAYRRPRARLSSPGKFLRAEASALHDVADRLDDGFVRAVDLLAACRGRWQSPRGKIGRRECQDRGHAQFDGNSRLPAGRHKAMHGDLGMVHPDDIAVVLSHSGESEEVVRLIAPWVNWAAAVYCLDRPASEHRWPVRQPCR